MKSQTIAHRRVLIRAFSLCIICLPIVFAAEQSLSQLTDEQLIKILWRDDAQAELDRRLHTYSKAQRDELTKKVMDKTLPRAKAEDLPPAELLDILLTSRPGSETWMKVTEALKKYHENASREERTAFKEIFVKKGMEVPVSATYSEESPVGSYGAYADLAWSLFSEEDGLHILETFYIEREVFAGIPHFISSIQLSPSVKAAPTAKRLEELYGSIEQYPFNVVMEEPGALRGQIILALGRCGEAGLGVLERIGWDLEAGALAVALTGTTRARDLLLERYNQLPPSQAHGRLTLLSALCRKFRSDEQCKSLVRRDLPQFLILPESDYRVSTLDVAIYVAELAADPVFIPQLEELLTSIQSKGFGNSTDATYASPSEIIGRETRAIESITKLLAKLRGGAVVTAKPKR